MSYRKNYFTILIVHTLFLPCLIMNIACMKKEPVVVTEHIMGTSVTQTIYDGNASAAAKEASARLRELESILSFHLGSSDLSKLNRLAGIGPVSLKPETIHVLSKSLEYSRLTGGAFNVLVGPLVKRWNVTKVGADVPSNSEIKALLPLVRWSDLSVDMKNGTAALAEKGQMADLGGIAKGYASDQVLDIYRRNGVTKARINIGGNIGILGTDPAGKAWRIGIQEPAHDRGQVLCVLSLTDCSVSTSGVYERYFSRNGKIYHHIIDPSTGYPADTGISSVTVVAPRSIDSDALAKIFVMGIDRGISVIKKIPRTEAVIVAEDGRIIVTDGLRDRFMLKDPGFLVEYR